VNADDATQRFYSLVWPERAAVLRVAQLLTGDSAAADDLAQETLLKAFKKLDTFRHGSNARGWLLTILRHTHIDRMRAAASEPGVSLSHIHEEPAAESASDAEEFSGANPETILAAFSDQQIIGALRKLPQEIRWTLLLVDVEGLSQKESAEVLQVPVGTIKSRVHRGHFMLRDGLLPLARDRRLVHD